MPTGSKRSLYAFNVIHLKHSPDGIVTSNMTIWMLSHCVRGLNEKSCGMV